MFETLRVLDNKTPQRLWAEKLRLPPPEMARTAVMPRQFTEKQSFLERLRFDGVRRKWVNVAAHHKPFEWVLRTLHLKNMAICM